MIDEQMNIADSSAQYSSNTVVTSSTGIKERFSVKSIDSVQCIDWIMNKHYLKRVPSISFAFGLYELNILVGICTFGTPPSSTLLKCIAGEKWAANVIELNRVVCKNEKNLCSFFISRAIKMLPKPKIIVSYADKSVNHNGYIYQALNFIYTGLSIVTYDPVIKGQEGKHHSTSGAGRGMSKKEMKDKWGDDVYWKKRDRKHRYIYFHGSKNDILNIRKDFKYSDFKYPKGENKNYDASYNPSVQTILF
jgi:hypothetical protein